MATRAALREAVTANADAHAIELTGVIEVLRAEDRESLIALAVALNDRGILTRRGGRWHVSNVRNLLARVETCQQD